MTNPLRLLVTGGSGLLGSEVVRQAAYHFGAVWATWYSHRPQSLPPGVQAVQLDIVDWKAVERLVVNLCPEIVIHTAYSKKEAQADLITGVGTAHIAQAARLAGARLVHVSSDVIFDGEHGPYDETAPPAPLHAYGRAKAAAEAAVQGLLPQAVIVRTSLICTLEPLDPVSAWIVDSLRAGQPITLFTDELRNPIWVQDLAAALLELATNNFSGVINVAGRQSLSRYQMGLGLARRFGLSTASLAAGSSQASGLIRPRDCRLDIRLAQQVLRTHLRGFEEGLSLR